MRFKAALVAGMVVLAAVVTAMAETKATYNISARNDGYEVRLSPATIQQIPWGATLEITLDDPAKGKTTVQGKAVKLSDSSFRIETGQRLGFLPTRGTFVRMRLAGGPRIRVGRTGNSCSGCPRDPEMLCEDPPSCTLCYCFQ